MKERYYLNAQEKVLTLAFLLSMTTLLTGCSAMMGNPIDEVSLETITSSINEYGPKTFDPDYVDEIVKINALDAPVVTLDDYSGVTKTFSLNNVKEGIVINGLKPATAYKAKVQAVSANGYSQPLTLTWTTTAN